MCVCACVYNDSLKYSHSYKIKCILAFKLEYAKELLFNFFLPFVTAWMDLEVIMLSEISQSEKDK